jgi:outer membrane autotransporter protein
MFCSGAEFVVAASASTSPTPITKDSAVVEAGLDLNLSTNASLGFSHSGQLARGTQDHSFKASLALSF